VSIVIRVFALLLLASCGYRTYLLEKDFLPPGRPLQRGLDILVASPDAVVVMGGLIVAAAAMSLIVLFGRRSGDGAKPLFRFDPWAKFLAAITVLNGVLAISYVLSWAYGVWRADQFDDFLKSSRMLQVLAQLGFQFGTGGVSLFLAFLVLLAPKSPARSSRSSSRPAAPVAPVAPVARPRAG
jgi:hypothetical protein